MNEFEVTSAHQLDRFVDGELSEAERREVLLALNREECGETCGWRRLALAFVEAQTWRQELGTVCLPKDSRVSSLNRLESASIDVPDNEVAQPTHRPFAARWSRIVALAACCLFAFGVGRWSGPKEVEVTRVENRPATAPATFAGAVEPDESTRLAQHESPGESTQQTLRLVLNDMLGGPPQAVDVPVVADVEIDPVDLLESPPSIPIAVQRALLRAGRVVHEQRQLFEVELSDGRRGVVPVSDVTVVNAGLDVYQ